MNRAFVFLLSVLSLLDARAAEASLECSPEAPAVSVARAVATGIVEADNARDLARVLGFYAADATLIPPGEAPVSGHAAIRPRYERLFADYQPAIEARIDEACAGDGFAFVRGHNGGRLSPRGGSPARDLDDDYLMLLRRGADGSWRITHLMWHRR